MSIGSAIFSKLKSTSNVTAKVPVTQILPELADQDTPFPQIVIEDAEGVADGVFGTPTLESAEVTVACIGLTKKEASEVAAVVKAALDNEAGTWAGIVVQGVFLTDSSTDVQAISEEERYYVTELVFKVWYAANQT